MLQSRQLTDTSSELVRGLVGTFRCTLESLEAYTAYTAYTDPGMRRLDEYLACSFG